jgi:protocatechuate 3,4-dioxygenase beta subunit
MKHLTPAWLALFFATSASAQAPSRNPPTKPPAEECSVSGMVVKLAGSEPLKTATVQLQNLEDRMQSHSTVTDAGGRFELKGINAGRYRLSVTRNGFVTQEYGQRRPHDPGAILALRPGQNLKDLLFRLIPSAVIAGRVINEEGDPLPWVQVSALREVYSRGKKDLKTETTVPTNDLGEYRLFDLRPGRYFIRAEYKPNERLIGRSEIERISGTDQRGYVPMYYPGSPDPARASPFTVKAGEEIPSVEILVRPVPAFTVRGRIFNMVSRRSATTYTVTLAPRESSQWFSLPQRNVLADTPDGSFVIPDVLPGSYTLMAFWAEEGRRYQAVQNVEVGNADFDGANLVIAPGTNLSGHVTWDGKPSLDADALMIFLRDADGSYGYIHRARTLPTGLFTLNDIFDGRYRVGIAGQSKDSYLKAVRYGAAEALEDGFAVVRGTNVPLEVTVSSRGGRIQGAVTGADSLPVTGVWVVLIPDEPHRDRFHLYQKTSTDQYGHFLLRGIPPGDYKIFCWEEVEDGAWEDPDFLKPFEKQGQTVSLEEADSKTVDVVAIKMKRPE